MPDHLHVLFELGERLSLDRVVAKLKALSKHDRIDWQPNYFEHRLRPNDLEGSYARYIFLNPYRSGLISCREVWPLWIVGSKGGNWDFLAMLEDGKFPPAEWLDEPEILNPSFVGE